MNNSYYIPPPPPPSSSKVVLLISSQFIQIKTKHTSFLKVFLGTVIVSKLTIKAWSKYMPKKNNDFHIFSPREGKLGR